MWKPLFCALLVIDSFLASWACPSEAKKGRLSDSILNSQAVLLIAACWAGEPDKLLARGMRRKRHGKRRRTIEAAANAN